MSNNNGNFKAYKILEEGDLKELISRELLEHFISNNILFLYSIEKKHAYVWIGKNTNQTLRLQIPKAENLFLEQNSNFRILRHFTVDEGVEPSSFFDTFTLSKKDLVESREKWRKYRLEIYGQIDEFKIQFNSYQMGGNFSKAKEFVADIIELAKKIQDQDIIDEYSRYLKEIEQKQILKEKKQEIQKQIPGKLEEISQFLQEKEFLKAHDIAIIVKDWYKEILKKKIPTDHKQILSQERIEYSQYLEMKENVKEKQQLLEESINKSDILKAHTMAIELQKIYKESLQKPMDGVLDQLIQKEVSLYANQLEKEKQIAHKLDEIKGNIQKALQSFDFSRLWNFYQDAESQLKISIKPELKQQWKDYKLELNQEQEKWEKQQELIRQKEKEIDANIEILKSQIKTALDAHNYQKARELCHKIQETAQKSTINEKITSTETNCQTFYHQIDKLQHEYELSENLNAKFNEIPDFVSSKNFDGIIHDLSEFLENPHIDSIPDKKEILEERLYFLKTQRDLYASKLELFGILEQNISDNQKKQKWYIAIENSKKIIQIAQELEKKDAKAKYTQLLNDFQANFEKEQKLNAEKQQKLMADAESLKNIIEVNEDILPLVDTLSIEDVLGDLSQDMDQMLDQIGSLLETNRVEIKTDMNSKSTIRTASGQMLEIEQVSEIALQDNSSPSSGHTTAPAKFEVLSGLENSFDESIEEAIIEDLIPYNFEINEIELNGEKPSEEPIKTLQKDGIKLEWTVHDIAPKDKIEIHYDLRRRVSRTIILPMDKELKIIKTHQNIQELNVAGLYDARMKFSNNFQRAMQGVVIEDIIPTIYLYNVKEPDMKEIAGKLEQTEGSLVKWNLKSIPDGFSATHWYKLLELYLFEELKMSIKKLSETGFDFLQKGDINHGFEKYHELMNLLEQYK